VPYWTNAEEKTLIEMLSKAESLKDLGRALNRSPEAIAMKLKRMHLAIPEKRSAISEANKVTENATTTTPKLEPVKFEALPSPNEAMGLLWAAIQRLQEPDVSKEEAKKLRLIIQGVKGYIHLDADYVMRIRKMEQQMLVQNKALAEYFRQLIDRETDSEKKARFEETLKSLEQSIKESIGLGVREPKSVKERQLS